MPLINFDFFRIDRESLSFLSKTIKRNFLGASSFIVMASLTGVLLYIINNYPFILENLGISEIDNYKKYIGYGCLVSVSIVFVMLIHNLCEWVKKIILERKTNKTLESNLKNLNSDEKAILESYIVNGKTTAYFYLYDGIITSLIEKKALYAAGDAYTGDHKRAYNIEPFAKKYLESNPELLERADKCEYDVDHEGW